MLVTVYYRERQRQRQTEGDRNRETEREGNKNGEQRKRKKDRLKHSSCNYTMISSQRTIILTWDRQEGDTSQVGLLHKQGCQLFH